MVTTSERWIAAAGIVLVACGNSSSADPCAPMSVRCDAEGRREVCGGNGSWTTTGIFCTTNVAVDDQVGSVCATKAGGEARCWNRDGTSAGDLVLADARYKRVQLAIAGPIGLTHDGRMLGARGAIPPELPPIADYRATNLWGGQGLCLLAQDDRLLYGRYLPEAEPPEILRVEAGPFVDVSCAWEGLVCAVKSDGTLWGPSCFNLAATTDGWTQVSISVGLQCGLTRGGAVRCRQNVLSGTVPTFAGGPFAQVVTTFQAACALDRAGILVCFRRDGEPLAVDPGPYTSITAGRDLVCGIRPDGTWACFRQNGVADTIDDDPTITALLPITPPIDADW